MTDVFRKWNVKCIFRYLLCGGKFLGKFLFKFLYVFNKAKVPILVELKGLSHRSSSKTIKKKEKRRLK